MVRDFKLTADHLQIWRCDLQIARAAMQPSVLSVAEKKRASSFLFEGDKQKYQAGRWLLRTLLASYTGVAAMELRLTAEPHVKPKLEGMGMAPAFNISHSENVFVAAFGATALIGIDIELQHTVKDAREVGRTVFSDLEMADLESANDVNRAFLLGWTRKEAFVKALGIGLGAVDLTAITVGLEVGNRIVPPLPGISACPIEIRSHLAGGEFIASACDAGVTRVEIRELNESTLKDLL